MAAIRAAFLTPTLLMGGAERWMLSLARACARERVEWTGTALSAWAPVSAELCREMSAFMPVYGDQRAGRGAVGGMARSGDRAITGNGTGGIVGCESAHEALRAATREADVLITWGVPRLGELMRGLETPVVYVSHGSGEWTLRTVRSSENRADYFVAVSEAARGAFSEGVREKTAIIHNGIDVERCTAMRSREEVRAGWGFGAGQRVIGYAGRYSFEKNPAAAAWAAQRLGGEYCAVYAGDGWREAEVRGLVGRIAGGRARFVPRDDCIGNVLVGFDVLVLASPSEGFSLAVAEAWYCGVPVVATRVGAIPELERLHGPLVAAVPVDPTPDDLADAVRMAESAEFRRTVVPQAQEVVCRHYTAGSMARRWTEYLCGIAGEPVTAGLV